MMNYVMSFVFILTALLYAPQSPAQFNNVQKSYSSLVNLLTNPGAELGKSGWTIATDTYSVTTTAANVGSGSAAFSWNSAGAARTLTSNAVAIPVGLYGKNGAMSCNIQTPSGSATHTINAWDGTNILSSATITSSTTYARTTINFPFPSSGSIYLRLASVAADEPQIYIDDCIIADAMLVNLSQVNQASFVGSAEWLPVSGCAWASSTAGFNNLAADSDCAASPNTLTGTATAAATKIPAVVFPSLAPGRYEVIMTGNYISDTSDCHWVMSDGTNRAGGGGVTRVDGQGLGVIVGDFTYTTAQGSTTFQPQGSPIGGGANCVIVLDAGTSTTAVPFKITVKRFPSTSELALSASANSFPTIQKFTSGSGTYTLPISPRPVYLKIRMIGGGGGAAGSGGVGGADGTDGGDTTFGTSLLVAGKGGKGIFQGAGGSGGTASLGTGPIGTALGGGGGMNASVDDAVAGAHNMGNMGGVSHFGGAGQGTLAGTTGGAAVANSGSGGGGTGPAGAATAQSGASGGAGGYVEAIITNPSATYSYAVGAGGTGGAAGATGSIGGAGGSGYIEVTEYYGNNAPILVGSVTSNSTGAERVERATITGGNPPTIASQSGSWLTYASRAGAGDTTWTLAGFSSTPTCVVSATYTAAIDSQSATCRGGATSATSARFYCNYVDDAASSVVTALDLGMAITCMGPR